MPVGATTACSAPYARMNVFNLLVGSLVAETYEARIARSRGVPITAAFVKLVVKTQGSRRRLAQCPYCDAQHSLVATVEVRRRSVVRNVKLLVTGPEVDVERGHGRILILECTACKRPVDPQAHHSPVAFVADHGTMDQHAQLQIVDSELYA